MIRKIRPDGNLASLCLSAFIITGLILSLIVSGFVVQNVRGEEEDEYEHEIVRGYFNIISYEGSSQETSIELEHEDENHFYGWSYAGGEWSGDTELLLQDDTFFEDGEWNVKIAVDHDVPTGDDWILTIDEEERSVNIVEPQTPSALMGSLNFLVEPYRDEAEDSDSITVPNDGNVPLTYELEYDDSMFEGELSHEVEDETLQPGERTDVVFTHLRATEGPERDVISNVDSKNIILTVYYIGELDREADGNVVIGAEKRLTVSGLVDVGYEGYEREYGDSYDIQYKESVEVDGDTVDDITFFVYPEEEVDIHLTETNVTIEGRTVDFDEPLNPEEDEIPIEITFKSHHMADGEITLIVDGDRYTTEIEIRETAPDPDADGGNPFEGQERVITGSVILVIIVGVMAVRYWRE